MPRFRRSKQYREYLQSKRWQQVRLTAFSFYGRICARCPATTDLQVHHRHYETLFHEGVGDLLILCRRCHLKQHRTPKPRRRPKHRKPSGPVGVVWIPRDALDREFLAALRRHV